MKGYKTLAVNGALAVLPIVDMAVNNGEILSVVLGAYAAPVISVIGLINVILRWVTTTPVLKSESDS